MIRAGRARAGWWAGAIAALAGLAAPAPAAPPRPRPAPAPAPRNPNTALAAGYSREVKAAMNAVSEKNLKRHAFHLAGDALEGRECGSIAGHRAGQYIVAHHRKYGLEDVVGDGSYLQYFPLRGATPKRGKLTEVNFGKLAKSADDTKQLALAYQKDLLPFRFSGDGSVDGTVVFAGYGISAPDNGYDDYAGLKVEGKIVLVLPGGPKGREGPFGGGEAAKLAEPHAKAETAERKGAAAFLMVADGSMRVDEPSTESVAFWPPPEGKKRLKIPALVLTEKAADQVFKLGGKRRTGLQKVIDEKLVPASAEFKRAWMELSVAAHGPQLNMGSNVLSLYRATAKDAVDEYIVIGAHRDHVGYGKFGSKGKPGEIHNGADDNASGTCGLLELVRVLAEKKPKLRRHVLFIHFDGEEKGLLGSNHYVGAPLVPLKQTVAMLNMDMIGRNATNQMMCGPPEDDRNAALQTILMKISRRFKIALPGKGMGQYMHRSDQAGFIKKGIPAIFLFGGMHGDYHTQNDDPAKLNFTKMANIAKLILLFAVEVAALEDRP